MPTNLDHIADRNGVELVRLAKLYEFPDFVKSASFDQTMAPRDLPVHLYADPVNQQYSCHTAASTWLSALYFTEKRAEFHPKEQERIQKRLDHYVNYWRIKSAVDAIYQRWQELHKNADDQLPDSMFAYVWVGDNGVKERHLRLKTAAEVRAAAEWLHAYRDRFCFADRSRMATRILEKAASYGAGLGEHTSFLERQAGRGIGNTDEILAAIEHRASLIPPERGQRIKISEDGKEERTTGLREQFLKIAEVLRTSPRRALQPDMLLKLAETLDMLDRQQGFTSRYDRELIRPEDVIFKYGFTKISEDLQNVVATTTGKLYSKDSLTKLSLDDVEALFGSEFIDRIRSPLGDIDYEKMAEEVSTLPRPDAELLDGLLSDSGVAPLLRKHAGVRQGLSDAEKRAWAQAYATV